MKTILFEFQINWGSPNERGGGPKILKIDKREGVQITFRGSNTKLAFLKLQIQRIDNWMGWGEEFKSAWGSKSFEEKDAARLSI